MKRNEFAGYYMPRYEDTDVTVTDVTHFNITGYECDCRNPVAFNLSDGTYWFSDNNDTCQVGSSLTDVEIGWNGDNGWVILNEDGSESQIDWL